MDAILIALLNVANLLLTMLVVVVFVGVVLSWLIAFNVVNPHNQLVATIWRFTSAITDPLLRPIRRVIPPLGGMDLSPLVLLLAVYFAQQLLAQAAVRI